jgi:hypothetical protein
MPDPVCEATGGNHVWVTLTGFEAGPGWDRGGTRCDECGVSAPPPNPDDWEGP